MGDIIDTYIILSEKQWHDNLIEDLSKCYPANWIRIDNPSDFSFDQIELLNPKKIFIPHWSYFIPSSIYVKWECIVFHMTDLPFGRGGSPLQNLIEKDFKHTRITALRVDKGIDTGDIYLKKDLSLEGSAYEIFKRSSLVIQELILEILISNPVPYPQEGEVTLFRRRSPKDSNIKYLDECKKIYDYIRMLDCEGYPLAFIENNSLKFEFSSATFDKQNNEVYAYVRIFKK